MSYKKYMLLRLLGILAIAGLGVWLGSSGNHWIVLPGVIILTIALIFLRRRVTEVVVDERVNAVAYRASRLAYLSFIILGIVVGSVLINIGNDRSGELFQIGRTLYYSVFALLAFYWLGYSYYNRKYGGKE